jgi:hypothetical protein
MFGGRFVGTLQDPNGTAILMSVPVTNGVTINRGDFVYYSSGRATNASVAGQKLIGCADETVTGNSAGTVEVKVIVNRDALYLIQNDNDTTTFAATHVGTYFDLIGATGAQLVDTSSTTTTGQLVCIKYNPQIAPFQADTTIGLFMIAETAFFGRAA